MKVFSANFEGRQRRKCTCAHASHPTVDPRKFSPRNLLFSHFRESFIPPKFPAIRYLTMRGRPTAQAAFAILRAFVARWYANVLQVHTRLEVELDHALMGWSEVSSRLSAI